MERELKFKAWHRFRGVMTEPLTIADIAREEAFILKSPTREYDWLQYTGIKDKNGKEVYEGDIIRVRKPYRSTQTHYGDNIPNGAYTEPMEPEIQTLEYIVELTNGIFGVNEETSDWGITPLSWINENYSEEGLRSAIGYEGRCEFEWIDPEEGDLQYLLETYKQPSLEVLLEFVSGIELIGNIYENPELLEPNNIPANSDADIRR